MADGLPVLLRPDFRVHLMPWEDFRRFARPCNAAERGREIRWQRAFHYSEKIGIGKQYKSGDVPQHFLDASASEC